MSELSLAKKNKNALCEALRDIKTIDAEVQAAVDSVTLRQEWNDETIT